MTWDLVTAREWAANEKGLINYCRVEWIRGGGTAYSSNSGCADYLSDYFGIYWQLLRTIFITNLATKPKRIAQ